MNEINRKEKKSYRPIAAVFIVSVLISLATSSSIMSWMGYFLILLSMLKLMDLKSFQKGFLNYDLLTKYFPWYGFVYPFAELFAGLGFLSKYQLQPVAIFSIVVGAIGGVSILKAVYVDKLDLNCACVGGNTSVPLGLVSFSENAVMFVMGLWILFGWY